MSKVNLDFDLVQSQRLSMIAIWVQSIELAWTQDRTRVRALVYKRLGQNREIIIINCSSWNYGLDSNRLVLNKFVVRHQSTVIVAIDTDSDNDDGNERSSLDHWFDPSKISWPFWNSAIQISLKINVCHNISSYKLRNYPSSINATEHVRDRKLLDLIVKSIW